MKIYLLNFLTLIQLLISFMSNIWFFASYDQPFGESNRTHLFSQTLSKNFNCRVVFYCNSFCHFKKIQLIQFFGLFKRQFIEGVEVNWINTPAYYNNGFYRLLNMIINFLGLFFCGVFSRGRPDIIVGTSVPITSAFAGVLVAKLKKSKFIYEIRDLWPEALVALGGIRRGGFSHRLMLALEKYILSHSDAVVTALPYVENHVRKHGLRDSAKVCWVPNPVPVDDITVKTNYLKDFNSFNLVYIGGFGRFHDIQTILDAAIHLQSSGIEGIAIHMFGSGEFYSHYQNLANNKLLSNLYFHGRISKELILPLQREADALLATVPNSKLFEFGINPNKIINYMASGKPIVYCGPLSANNPIEESRSGVCTPAGDARALFDAIVQLYKQRDSELFAMYGRSGLLYSNNNYSIDVLGRRYFEILSVLKLKD